MIQAGKSVVHLNSVPGTHVKARCAGMILQSKHVFCEMGSHDRKMDQDPGAKSATEITGETLP